jgi:peptidoglycan/LPS O-acetylase OafA/YrhL
MEIESSHVPFYVAGLALVVFALGISAIGIMRAETFPSSRGGRAAVVALATVLVVAAMAAAVLTAG